MMSRVVRGVSAAAALVFLGCGGGTAPRGPSSVETPSNEASSDARRELDGVIASEMKNAHVPGVAIVAVKGDAVVLSAGYGLADIASGRKMTPDDVMLVASISKTVTATALLQKRERGAIDLDDDVNAKAPFAVRNPRYPREPITYRMLLTHTSSIADSDVLEEHVVTGGDSPEPLKDFLSSYLEPEGELYAPEHWASKRPGEAYDYSNVAVALEGALDEVLAGETLEADCKAHIFGPLGMAETSWSYAALDPKRMATLYGWGHPEGESAERFEALEPYGFPDYPDGQLRTSALQLSVFMRMLMSGGTFQGVKVLDRKTVEAMLEPQVPELEPSQGLALYYEDFGDADSHLWHLVGHSGSYDGVSADMFWDPVTKVGFVLIANSDVYLRADEREEDALMAIETAVLAYASR
ncbi:MAG: serine hydrolase domain-containing protein [Polyangiaceae bacterium]